jgi:hypothetical protein
MFEVVNGQAVLAECRKGGGVAARWLAHPVTISPTPQTTQAEL